MVGMEKKLYNVDVFNIGLDAFQTLRNYEAIHIAVLASMVAEGKVIVLAIREVG